MKRILATLLFMSCAFAPWAVGDVFEGEAYVAATSAPQAVTVVTLANPAVFTIAGHNLFTGNLVQVVANGDMNELGEVCYPVTKLSANTFSLGIATKNLCPLAAVNITTDTINIYGHTWSNGQAVVYTKVGADNIGGLTTTSTYYVRDATPNSFKLAESAAGAAIDLTTTGSAAQYFAYTAYTAGMTIGGGGFVVPDNAPSKYISIINGSVAHVSAVPVFVSYSKTIPTTMPVTTTPSGTADYYDPGQPGDTVGEVRYVAMNCSAGAVYVRYRVVY